MTYLTTDERGSTVTDANNQNVCKVSYYNYSTLGEDSSYRDPNKSSPRSANGFRMPTSFHANRRLRVPWMGSADFRHTVDGMAGGCPGSYTKMSGCLEKSSSSGYRAGAILLPDAPTYSESLFEECVNACYEDLKNQRVNLGTFLAELPMGVDLVTSTARNVFRAYAAARKGNWATARKHLGLNRHKNYRDKTRDNGENAAASKWLEMQYGWMPMVSDVYSFVQDVTNGFASDLVVYTRKQRSSKQSETGVAITPAPNYVGTKSVVTDRTCKVRLDYTVDIAAVQRLAQQGVLNPLEVAWELVPFSFVVDWFASVGDYLATFDSDLGLAFRCGTRTDRELGSMSASLSHKQLSAPPGNTYVYSASGTTNFAYNYVQRLVLDTPPSGGVVFQNPWSFKRFVNAVALFVVNSK